MNPPVTEVTASQRGNRSRYWLGFIAFAVLIHLILLLSVRESFFAVFKKSVEENPDASGAGSLPPHTIITIPIEIEGEEPEVVDLTQPDERQTREQTDESDARQRTKADPADVDAIIGDDQHPLPSVPSTRATVIPPRPVEITWPQTRKLSHCLGLHVDIRIHVGEKGEILAVEPAREDNPPDCQRAALDAARKIVFLPGRINGKPAPMWTEIRIEFRKQSG